MKTTLFVEISEITARILVYNEVDCLCHYVDITGGYGNKSVPLHIHYLKNGEILIGQDALLYDEEEGSLFIESILYTEGRIAKDYIINLQKKVEELLADVTIHNIVLITDKKLFKQVKFLDLFNKNKDKCMIEVMSVSQAVVGWYYESHFSKADNGLGLNNAITNIGYFDYKNFYLYQLSNHLESNTIGISSNLIAMDLNAINVYYINLLDQLHMSGASRPSKHQLSQLYNNQKATIHKQFIKSMDVNVYSSIFFPPQKLVLPFKAFSEFKNNWYEQVKKEKGINRFKELENVDKLILSGAYDLASFLNSFGEFKIPMDNYQEYMLLDGGYNYYKADLKNQEIINKQSLDYTIGVYNEKEFYSLIEEHEKFKDSYDVELILTNNQREIQLYSKVKEEIKAITNITIKEPKSIQRILLKIRLNKIKEIEEVSYELRSL